MKPIIITLSLAFIICAQPDTTHHKFDATLDSSVNKTSIDTSHKSDSLTECDKEAVAATITQYQQQLHRLQQATYELTRDQLATYKQNSLNNSMALISIGTGIVAGAAAISNALHEKTYKTPVIEISLGMGIITVGLSKFIRQW